LALEDDAFGDVGQGAMHGETPAICAALGLAGDSEPFDLVGVVESPPGAIAPRAEGAFPIELDDAAHRQIQSAADVPWCE
jgi:hypothetical protein